MSEAAGVASWSAAIVSAAPPTASAAAMQGAGRGEVGGAATARRHSGAWRGVESEIGGGDGGGGGGGGGGGIGGGGDDASTGAGVEGGGSGEARAGPRVSGGGGSGGGGGDGGGGVGGVGVGGGEGGRVDAVRRRRGPPPARHICARTVGQKSVYMRGGRLVRTVLQARACGGVGRRKGLQSDDTCGPARAQRGARGGRMRALGGGVQRRRGPPPPR